MGAKKKPAKRPTKAAWTNSTWEKVADAQHAEIVRKYGKDAASKANYGWGDATRPGRVDVATKVYVRGGAQVLSTTADFPSAQLTHSWEAY